MVCELWYALSVRDQYTFNESVTSMHESLQKCLWPEVGRLQPFFINKVLLERRDAPFNYDLWLFSCYDARTEFL